MGERARANAGGVSEQEIQTRLASVKVGLWLSVIVCTGGGIYAATEEQLRMVTTLGCGFAQGFHFSEPVPAGHVEGLLERPMPAFT